MGQIEIWSKLYPVQDPVTSIYVPRFGVIEDNNILSLGQTVGTDDDVNREERVPKKAHNGVFGSVLCPHSPRRRAGFTC